MIYEDLLGLPYSYGARGPQAYDCWGLCLEVAKRVGIILPAVDSPDEEPAAICGLMDSMKIDFLKIPGPEPYAVVAFQILKPWVNHCGMVLEDKGRFIHIFRGRNVIIERLDQIYWKGRIEGFYRWPSSNREDGVTR